MSERESSFRRVCRYARWIVLPPLIVVGFALYLVLGLFLGYGTGEDACE